MCQTDTAVCVICPHAPAGRVLLPSFPEEETELWKSGSSYEQELFRPKSIYPGVPACAPDYPLEGPV